MKPIRTIATGLFQLIFAPLLTLQRHMLCMCIIQIYVTIYFSSGLVGPDAENKKAQILPKVTPIRAKAVFKKSYFFKINLKIQHIFGPLLSEVFVAKSFHKLPTLVTLNSGLCCIGLLDVCTDTKQMPPFKHSLC